jgi:hypothetical protein
MSIRVAALWAVVSILVCGGCAADWLVLRGGKKVETAGQWVVQGNLLTIREAAGRPKTVMLSVVDFDATLRANPRAPRPAGPGWHVTPEGIKRLQEAARQQEALAAQMRAQREAGMEADAVAGKPGKNGAGKDEGSGQSHAQAKPQNGGRGKGFDALDRCKSLQDSPKAYSDCLAGH